MIEPVVMVQGSLVEGIGDDLVKALLTVLLVVVPVLCLIVWNMFGRGGQQAVIHTDNEELVEDVREQLRNDAQMNQHVFSNNNQPQRQHQDLTCPVCLNEAQYPVETNCGHIYCANCMITYWNTGRWQGAVRCPSCRQQVTILLRCFSEAEQQSRSPERQRLVESINQYNRRFSGQPLTWIEYIRDLPTILRHCFFDFFSIGGLIWMFRLRIFVCFTIALLYLLSPLDIIPEIAFGIFGLLDDLFVVLLLAIYISILYRRYIEAQTE